MADQTPASSHSFVFESYHEAVRELLRRQAADPTGSMSYKVVRSPYQGFVVRSWPVDLLAEPELHGASPMSTSTYPTPKEL